jgi:flagellar hook-associated protein 1
MSLNAVISSGLSGLSVSQRGLQVTSANVTNVNTPGYARVDMTQEARYTSDGASSGVDIANVRRAADRFLATASYSATATYSAREARSDILDRAQLLFGDPSDDGSVFASIERSFAGFIALGAEPTSTVRRASTISQLQSLWSEIGRVGEDIERLRLEADQRIGDAIGAVNGILTGVASLNIEIQRTQLSGGDSSAAENAQAQLIDDLAELMDIRVGAGLGGGVEVRAGSGEILVGARAVRLEHEQITTFYGAANSIEVVDENGVRRPFSPNLTGGTLAGLIRARETDLPRVADQLGAMAGAVAEVMNSVHNANSAAPAPSDLIGRNTGLVGNDLLNFRGQARIGVVDSAGALQANVLIDFDAATVSINGGPAMAYAADATTATIADLRIGIGSVPGLDVQFSEGAFRLQATGGGGIVVAQGDPPAKRAGKGFSHFFGLNDLVQRQQPIAFETGLRGSAEGFTGGAIVFRIRDGNGNVLQDRSITPPGGTLSDMITAVNGPSGLGGYASLIGPDTEGRIALQSQPGYTIEVASDATVRGDTELSFSSMFGLSAVSRAGRAIDMQLNQKIAGAPERLALARPDLNAPIGARVLERGDARGAQALANASTAQIQFPATVGLGWQTTTLTQYAANIGAEIGRNAADAERLRDSAEQIRAVTRDRRKDSEAVRLDDELMRMSQYQQGYAAASRLIQAAKDMYDILLRMV